MHDSLIDIPTKLPEDCIYDEYLATRAEDFFPRYLVHVKGHHAGTPFKLLPYQKSLLRQVFGILRKEDLTRLYREVYLEIPKKNGKTSFTAGLCLFVLFCDRQLHVDGKYVPEYGAEIYSAAGDKLQASIIFDIARDMIEASPQLSNRCKVFSSSKTIELKGRFGTSIFRSLSSDSYTKHGYNAHIVVIDELHVQKNDELYQTLRRNSAARTQPLLVMLTTAGGKKEGLCWDRHCYAESLLEGKLKDRAFLPIIYAADETDDYRDPEVWKRANPGLGISIREDYMRREAKNADISADDLAAFLRLHLNIWTSVGKKFLPMADWDSCNTKIDQESLKGKRAVLALDLSITRAMTALCCYFPDEKVCLLDFWLPVKNRQNILTLNKRDRVRYDVWEHDGLVTLVDRPTTDYDLIYDRILKLAEIYNVEVILFDPFNSSSLVNSLDEAGFITFPFFQTNKYMSPAAKELKRLILNRELNHLGNPILRWMAEHTDAVLDRSGNIRLVVSEREKKIDGIIALAMCVGWSVSVSEEERESDYEESRKMREV